MAVYQRSQGRTLEVINTQMFKKDKKKLRKLCEERKLTQAEMIEKMLKDYEEDTHDSTDRQGEEGSTEKAREVTKGLR